MTRSAPHHSADDCVPDATDHMEALGFEQPRPCTARSSVSDASCVLDAGHPADSQLRFHRFPKVAGSTDLLSTITRIRIHERLMQAQGLIDQAADELGGQDETRGELKAHGHDIWMIGLEVLDDIDADRHMTPTDVGGADG